MNDTILISKPKIIKTKRADWFENKYTQDKKYLLIYVIKFCIDLFSYLCILPFIFFPVFLN